MRGAFTGNQARVKKMLEKLDRVGAGDLVNGWEQPGVTALSVACEKGWVGVVRCLVRHPSVDVSAVSDARASALHVAAQGGHAAVLRVLLEDPRVDVNALATQARITALMLASKHGKVSAIAQLVAAGADLDVRDAVEGKSALTAAAVGGHLDAMRELLAAGADPWSTDASGMPAVAVGVSAGPEHVQGEATRLLAAFLASSTFFATLLRGEVREMDNAADIAPGRGPGGPARQFLLGDVLTPTQRAFARTAPGEVFSHWWSHVLPRIIDLPLDDAEGRTLVWRLCARGHAHALRYVLKHVPSADVNLAETKTGSAPLHKACEMGHAEAARALLEHPRTDVNVRTLSADAATPLVFAAFGGHAAVVDLLLDAGADPAIPWTPPKGKVPGAKTLTPAQVARARGHHACAARLDTHAMPPQGTPR